LFKQHDKQPRIRNREPAVSTYNYKLTEAELRHIFPAADVSRIVVASKERKPGKWAKRIVKVALNKAKSVWVQNVQFYGGEHFGEPYHFPAEIRYATTESAFRRCVNRLNVRRLRMPFTY
jgi:hypothetical protein